MKTEIIEKFRSLLTKAFNKSELTQAEFAKKLGISQAYLSGILSGNKSGERKMFEIAKKAGIPTSLLMDSVGNVDNIEWSGHHNTPIPVISWVNAGKMAEVIDAWPTGVSGEGEPVFSKVKTSPQTFALVVRGDSMEPRFIEGDIIIVDPTLKCDCGDFCVVELNGEATFKIFKENEKEIRLKASNDKYPDIVVDKGSSVDFKVIGRVVDIDAKLK